jgi:hypothetical protein
MVLIRPVRPSAFYVNPLSKLRFRPHEVVLALTVTQEADLLLLFNVARMTHKYQFRSIEKWALLALTEYFKRPISSTSHQKSPTLAQITQLAVLCDEADLLDATVLRWKRLIGEKKDIALALNVAEQYNLRGLLGLAYHAMMLKGREYWDADPLLTRDQRIKLLSGFYSMSHLWPKIDLQPPTLIHDQNCIDATRKLCEQSWASLWKAINVEMSSQAVILQSPDVLGKMMLAECVVKALVKQDIPTQGLLDGMLHCTQAAVAAAGQKVKEMRENLVDFFVDVS